MSLIKIQKIQKKGIGLFVSFPLFVFQSLVAGGNRCCSTCAIRRLGGSPIKLEGVHFCGGPPDGAPSICSAGGDSFLWNKQRRIANFCGDSWGIGPLDPPPAPGSARGATTSIACANCVRCILLRLRKFGFGGSRLELMRWRRDAASFCQI